MNLVQKLKEALNNKEVLRLYRQALSDEFSYYTPEEAKKKTWRDEKGSAAYQLEQRTGLKLKLVDNFGGEDQGSEWWWVFSITDQEGNTVHTRLDGWYASHYGSEWEDTEAFYEVETAEKTITYWRAKK